MTAIEQAWCILKNEDYEHEAVEAFGHPDGTDYSGGFHPETSEGPTQHEEGCGCPAAQLLKKLYYAGMIMGAGGAGGAEGGLDHPMLEELSDEVIAMFGWPGNDHPMQHQEDELGNPISGPMMDR